MSNCMLHIYHGSVRLSFWTESASRTEVIDTTVAYRIALNESTRPHSRRSPVQARTETAKAILPSTVLPELDDHRTLPKRLPTTDAYNFLEGAL